MNGDVFGYAPNPPASAADCIAQAQRQTIVQLTTVLALDPSSSPYLKHNDAFCVSDKAGYVAWMQYVGPTTGDTQGDKVLQFKIRIWKPGS